MDKKTALSLFLGTGLSVIALYFSFKNVPFDDLIRYLGTINYFWVLPSVVIIILSFAVRAVRWQLILKTTQTVGFWRAFHPMMIGFMMNCVLPARVGEFARPAILYKKNAVPYSTGLATVVAERMFDATLLIVFFAVVLVTVLENPSFRDVTFGKYTLNKQTLEMIGSGMVKFCAVLILGIIIVSINTSRNWINKVILAGPSLLFMTSASFQSKVRESICTRLIGIMDNIAGGFSLVKDPKKLFACSGLSLIIWGLSALSYYMLALGSPGIDLSFPELSAVMVIICFFIALPSAPGFWGLWEAGGVFALSIFGITTNEAAGFTLANHAVQIFPVIIMGLVSAVATGVNVWQVSKYKHSA